VSKPIILEVKQDLDHDGYEDEDGTVHYDDRIITPWGELGVLKVHLDGEEVVIDRAPYVILVSKRPPEEWVRDADGTTFSENFYGSRQMTVKGRNGEVRYQLIDRPVEWSDQPGQPVEHFLAVLSHSRWVKEAEKSNA
jgi:hypothetical protein